jgi:hypothetical protein
MHHLDYEGLVRAELEAITSEQVLDLLTAIPQRDRKHVLRGIGLQSVHKVNRGIASQVIAQLKGPRVAKARLLQNLMAPIVHLFDHMDQLADDWLDFTGRDPHAALRVVASHNLLVPFAIIDLHIPASMYRLGLLAAIGANSAGAVAAVAFLAVEGGSAKIAHEELKATHPSTPVVPEIDFSKVTVAARFRAMGLLGAEERIDRATLERTIQTFLHDLEAPASDTAGSDQPAILDEPVLEDNGTDPKRDDEHANGGEDLTPEEDTDPDVGADPRKALLTAVENLEPRWQSAHDAARRVIAALDQESAPSLEDLDALTELSAEARHLASALSVVTGRHIPPTRNGLTEAASGIRRDLAAEDTSWLQRLTQVEGPDAVIDALNAIRNLARLVLEGTDHLDQQVMRGLAALHRLIMLGEDRRSGQPVEYGDVSAAEAAAREALPPDAQGAILAAAFGELRMPEDDPEGSDDSNDSEVVSERLPEAASADEKPERETQPAEDPPLAEDSRLDPPSIASDPEVDLSDLDELLESGAGLRRPPPGRPIPSSQPLAAQHQVAAAGAGTPTSRGEANCEAAEVVERAAGLSHLDVVGVESDLLAQHRFGLAADLHAASDSDRASIAARRLAALAARLHHPTGALAAAFAQEATFVKRERLADDRSGQLVAWASAARAAVLSPSAGAAGILAELALCVANHPALTEVGQAFAEASRAGVIVMPEAADAVSALAEAEGRAAEQARAAGQLLENASVRTIKYAPANVVYQKWMSVNGPLGSLLEQIAHNDHSSADDVRGKVVALRGQVEKSIDETFAECRQKNSRIKIVAGARATLRQRYLEVVDTADAWAEAAAQALAAALASGTMHVWQATPLARLRTRLAKVRAEVVPALDLLRAELDAPGAAAAALDLVSGAIDICDGRPPQGPEVSPAYALHEELLASDLPLSPSELIPDGGFNSGVLPALLRLADGPAADPLTVYDARALAGDHDLTTVLIGSVRAFDPAAARDLEQRRERDVAALAPSIAAEVAAITTLIDVHRMAGTLDDQSWSVLASRVEALTSPTRRDYGRIRRELTAITGLLDQHKREKVTETLERIEVQASTVPQVAAAADTLTHLARTGQVASAEEYLEQVLTGETLPTRTEQTDHFTRFFPAVPDACANHPGLLEQLRSALAPAAHEGQRPGDVSLPTALAALTAAAGTDPAALSRLRAESGSRAIGAWLALRRQRTDAASALRFILAEAGLEFEHATIERGPAGRTWISLDGVRGAGSALTPTLGSAMSPSGDRLRVVLVWSSASPATLVEWMSEEPADQTVLAIWLPGPLSAAERRSLANASRGRPRPPVLLLDEAALAYLVCQAEPRRSTFAAIALPFTAASSYRDTPGYTAPEMFYGRTEELAAIKDLTGSSILYGGRQLGKSALLRTAQAQFDNGGDRRAILVSIFTVGGDADPERLWSALWPRLAEFGIAPEKPPAGDLAEAAHRAIVEWATARPGRALLMLLDEADAFLEADAAANRFTNVDWCRRIMDDTDHRAKFVFAGLHRTARFESLPNQPLAHFGQPVSVGPLHPQAAHDLLVRPLAALGFRFEDPIAIPARVLALANNMPALLQLFGAALIAHLISRPVPADGPPSMITGEDIDEVFADAKLRDAFREKYIYTLNLDHRYLVIAYVVAYAAHQQGVGGSVPLAQLSHDAREAWPAGFAKCGADDFRSLVTECVDLGVLAVDNGGYRIRTPNVLRLLGTEEEVFETLSTAAERLHVQSPADGAAYRRRIKGSHQRMPLTERQIGEVFKAQGRVLVINGSQALGIDRVLGSLRQAEDEGHSRLNYLHPLPNPSPHGLQHAVSMLTGGHTLIAADMRKSTTTLLEGMLTAAKATVGQHADSLTIALITGPNTAPAWIGHDDRIDLTLVDEVGLRLWSDEDNLPFRDDQVRRGLLAATGGWPMLLARVAEAARTGGPMTDPAETLADLTAWTMSAPGAATLVKAAGIGDVDHPVAATLATVFRLISDLTASVGETREDLAELLVIDTPELAASARRVGFTDLAQVIDALVALNCIAADQSGQLQTEPVLTRAFQTVIPERT